MMVCVPLADAVPENEEGVWLNVKLVDVGVVILTVLPAVAQARSVVIKK
jgi:hypothetical protein